MSARVVDALMPENAYTYEEMETHILAYDSESDDQSSQAEKKTHRMVVVHTFPLLSTLLGSADQTRSGVIGGFPSDVQPCEVD